MNNRVALITGSSRGIGRAIAVKLARDGFRVIINYRSNKEQAEQVLQEVETAGGKGLIIRADVSNSHEAGSLVESGIKEFGQIDVLVNNAGINKDQLMLRISDEDWEKVISTNLNAAFYCSRAVLKSMMKKRYGRIINISSVVGICGNAGQTHYAAAKSGLLGFTCSIAREYGSRGINANVIAPGYIQSDMTADLNQEQTASILNGIAVGRLGTPDDIAGVAAFLASPAADYISGQVIRVDGGLSGL